MIQRRHHNRIDSIKHSQGNQLKEHVEIERELVHYYKTLLSETQLEKRASIQKTMKHIPKLVS
jgi:hypothetical protein